jgi:hypothetical protein
MTTYQVVPNTVDGERLRWRLAAFLSANGIDPNRVPLCEPVTVTDTDIRVNEVERQPDGGLVYDPVADVLVTHAAKYPLIVPMESVA